MERCVELINRTHAGRDLFRPYTAEFLADRLDEGFWGARPPGWVPVYRWEDMRVIERGGEIVACAGLWDRGRDLRERWRHRETGDERTISTAALLDIDPEVIRALTKEKFSKKPALLDSNDTAIALGYDYARKAFQCPLPIRLETMDATKVVMPRGDMRMPEAKME